MIRILSIIEMWAYRWKDHLINKNVGMGIQSYELHKKICKAKH